MTDATLTEPRCAWSGDAGELRKEAAGSVVICGQAKEAMNHQHSLLCPLDHAEDLICHVFVETEPTPAGLDAAMAGLVRALPDRDEEREVILVWHPTGPCEATTIWSSDVDDPDALSAHADTLPEAMNDLATALVARAEAARLGRHEEAGHRA